MTPTVKQMAEAVERFGGDQDNMADYYEHGSGDMVLANEYRNAAATLRAAANALLAMEWRPIESAPKCDLNPHDSRASEESEFVFVTNEADAAVAFFQIDDSDSEHGGYWESSCGAELSFVPTKWMPLPPTDGEGA